VRGVTRLERLILVRLVERETQVEPRDFDCSTHNEREAICSLVAVERACWVPSDSPDFALKLVATELGQLALRVCV
jgi:hypothetical protein